MCRFGLFMCTAVLAHFATPIFHSSSSTNRVGFASPAPEETTAVYNFDSDAVGQMPAKFSSALTGRGIAGEWSVKADPSAPSPPNVLAQTSTDSTDYRFPVAILNEGSFGDLTLSVKFKAISGRVDRAAGLIFRIKDVNNYYIARANALENNYVLFRVVNGRRSPITSSRLKVASGEWHELRVECVSNKITCYYDNVKRIETTDNTFKEAGRVGLWTKADSVTYFDDLKISPK